MKLLRVVGVLVLTLVMLWLSAELTARWYLHRAMSSGWPVSSGKLGAVLQRFPKRSENRTAQDVEAEAWKIGIDMYQRSGAARPDWKRRPIGSAWKNVEDDVKAHIREVLRESTPQSAPTPHAVALFLSANESTIQNIAKVLISDGPPEWPIDLQRGFEAPIPNLLGSLSLTRLLITTALEHRNRGQRELSWRDLEAASRLPDGLSRRPELISQIIGLFEATMVVGAMRHISGPPPPWALEWPSGDLRKRLNEAATADAWMFYRPFDSAVNTDLFTAFAGNDSQSTFGGKVLSIVLSPYLRASAANTAMAHRGLLHEYAALPACSQAIVIRTAVQAIPEWNVFGRVAFPGEAIGAAYQRLDTLLAHIEGTRLLVAARRAKEDSGRWPTTAPDVQSPCAAR